jgi:hypothetical protein
MISGTCRRFSFDVFEDASGRREAVKRGFSWPAFFFTFGWALVKRMWLIGLGTLGLAAIVGFSPALSQFQQQALGDSGLGLLSCVLFGFMGNKWRREQLVEQGWRHVAVVRADNLSCALEQAQGPDSIQRNPDMK